MLSLGNIKEQEGKKYLMVDDCMLAKSLGRIKVVYNLKAMKVLYTWGYRIVWTENCTFSVEIRSFFIVIKVTLNFSDTVPIPTIHILLLLL